MSQSVILPPQTPATPQGIKPGGWWHEAGDGRRITCDLCPRACTLGEGDRGFCFVRQNLGGQMVSTTYGRSTGFCIDPIEKKPLNHFYPGTACLSFGTAGCNLGCKFCQNWSISKSKEIDALSQLADPDMIARAAKELHCRSVAFTYNDPVIWAEYAIDTAKACRAQGVKTVAVTAGYITPAARPAFYEVMDAANVDLKGFTERFYWKLTSGHLEQVLDTIRWLVHETDVWVELTNLVIPQANDNRDELRQMCDWIAAELGPDVPIHFTAFHPDFRLTDRGPTPPETLLQAYDIAQDAGLNFVYTGNVHDPDHQNTYCPKCQRVVIQRDGYVLGQYNLHEGRCRSCKTAIKGRFEEQAGNWGPRRQPIRISDFALPAAAPPSAMGAAGPAQAVAELDAPIAAPEMETDAATVEDRRGSPDPQLPTPDPRLPTADLGRPNLAPEDEKRILQAASRQVIATVCGHPAPTVDDMLGATAGITVFGAFVTLKRQGQLRSCCGFLGQSVPLAEAIGHAGTRAAKDDPRFPPISPTELPHLEIDVWLLWNQQVITARGEDRVEAITIGKHGLQIARGNARGLLLPGVAVEHHFAPRQFLEQICVKAGLPSTDWLRDDAQLMTFEGQAIEGPLDTSVATGPVVFRGPTPTEVSALAMFCRENLISMFYGGATTAYLQGGYDATVCGLQLTVRMPGRMDDMHLSSYSLRPDKPLQSTLYKLCEAIAGALRARNIDPDWLRDVDVGVTILVDPAMHGPAVAPDLTDFDPQKRALLVMERSHSAWIYEPQGAPEQLLALALRAAGASDVAATAVFSMAVYSNVIRASAAFRPQTEAGPQRRPAAVAGMFYPASKSEIDEQLTRMIPVDVRPEADWSAALVPHAGWVYSGRLAAATLARITIPDRVIILCPKHRQGGADWAVAPHKVWELPSGDVPSDLELVQKLVGTISGLEPDAVAHRQEHAIEVQLPIIHRLAPQARVVGITIGGGSVTALARFAEGLAEVLSTLNPRPLLVISSDMNHYADEATTRQLDRQALDALESLDPGQLYETIQEKRISMCGMMPAVIVLGALERLNALKRCQLAGYTTSAEASGDTSRVVGYAGVLFGK